jgi:hypothetical protein
VVVRCGYRGECDNGGFDVSDEGVSRSWTQKTWPGEAESLENRQIVWSCDGEAGKKKKSCRNWYDDGG